MVVFYQIGIYLFSILIQVFSLFNSKAKKWVEGRKEIFQKIENEVSGEKTTWFHFPSLGEFEQGRTVLERYRDEWPQRKIVVTFFSPSGYEVRKNYPLADHIYYLPIDSASHAKRFIELINPQEVFFTKYDYWYFYFKELSENNIPLYMISSIFRPGQVFFQFYGSFFRKTLSFVSHFFVQNEESVDLLSSINLNNVTITGDTRFDRVMEVVNQAKDIPVIADFVAGKDVLVAGSTWPQDTKLLCAFHQEHKRWRMIIVPHDITGDSINDALAKFPKALLYSQLKAGKNYSVDTDKEAKVIIVDNVGMLSSIYRYGDVCYIGGGFGKGIHNSLEAAAYGRGVIFGPKYQKFEEAKDLVKAVAAFPVKNEKDLIFVMQRLMDQDFRINVDGIARDYVYSKAGATERIISFLKERNTNLKT